MKRSVTFLLAALAVTSSLARGETHSLTLAAPAPAASDHFHLGTTRRPDGHTLTVDTHSLLRDGQPWVPAMGEFHFSRYPAAEWRDELRKMKAGGIDIVSTYVFWIHHEEIEGTWDWSGQRNLRAFVEAARDAGLLVVARIGPYCHGEVRNGGLPEWIFEHADWNLRSTDPRFLEATGKFYTQIAAQFRGLLWKDGGPVIGVQLDNEVRGPAEYLLALKHLAREAGIDVPLYTRTGWPALATPMPVGEILPLYGGYIEGFWDRSLDAMPGDNWREFAFRRVRITTTIASEQLGAGRGRDVDDPALYPYFACELGGGMADSYHRRILLTPGDVPAVAIVQLGSGSALPGYYMYHGGTNPDGQRMPLHQSMADPRPGFSDVPLKTYDFSAPLGEFGQIRAHYHALRRLHLFLHDFGPALAGMAPTVPEDQPTGKNDVATLRWAARTDGRSGYVFVSNYQRFQSMPAKPDVQFTLTLPGGAQVTLPERPVTLPADESFFWPFNLDLGGATLDYATAQPLCVTEDERGTRTMFFAETPGVAAEFAFAAGTKVEATAGRVVREGERIFVRDVPPGRGSALRVARAIGSPVHIVLLTAADSLALWKGEWRGRERVFLTMGSLRFGGDDLELTAATADDLALDVFPAPVQVRCGDETIPASTEGVFQRLVLPSKLAPPAPQAIAFESVHPPGPLRTIRNGKIAAPVAAMPDDADFADAAVWRVHVPAKLAAARRPLLRFHYVGDVARLQCDGKLLTDDFYNGSELDLGLWRYPATIAGDELTLAVLPLQKNAPIYLAPSARRDVGAAASVAELRGVELLQTATLVLRAR